MRAADVIAQRLAEAGIRHAFGIPGGEILTLIDALAKAQIRFVTARHETPAGLMAEGTSLHTQAPALLVVTVGPGVSNAVNAIANAYLDRVPMIVLSGAVDRELIGSYTHQVFDERALLTPVTKASLSAEAGRVDQVIAGALALAMRHPRGPVHVAVPVGVASTAEEWASAPVRQAASHPDPSAAGGAHFPTRAGAYYPGGASARAQALATASAWLAHAERPLVIAGLEAVLQPVPAELARLLRDAGLPLLTTYKAKGVLPEQDPHCIGAIGLSPRADEIVAPLLAAADVVLLVGYDPVEMRARYRQPFAAQTRVIELCACPRTHGMHQADLVLEGDLARDLAALHVAILDRAPTRRWTDAAPRRTRQALREAFVPRAGFDPQRVAETLARVVPRDVRMTIDTGAHRILLSQTLQAHSAGQILQSNGLCTMGYAVPAAIGLALASRRPVVAVTGDGGFEMIAGELATLRDLGLPVTIIVFDDQSLALIDEKQREAGLVRQGVWLGGTDHAAVARAFGGDGVRVGDAEALELALRNALASDRFSVIACTLERGAYAGLL
jgi:acetolactate synthase-1/2/3 large subunit